MKIILEQTNFNNRHVFNIYDKGQILTRVDFPEDDWKKFKEIKDYWRKNNLWKTIFQGKIYNDILKFIPIVNSIGKQRPFEK